MTNSRLASALLALADAAEPGTRPVSELRQAALTLRQLDVELHGRRLSLSGLPGVSPRAADAVSTFLSCGSDESISDRLAAMLDREDPCADRKRDYLSAAEVDRILAAPDGVSMADLRGDLHLHTARSDGRMTLAALHHALEARGDSYAFLTDHARDCAVAGGLFPDDFRAEKKELEGLNDRTDRAFAMLLGAEANIAEDGTLDVTPARVPELAAVVASIHTELRSNRDQTARLMRAIETPGVAVLGHPRGRLYNIRSGVRADWARLFARAAALKVAIEINGVPDRLDLDPRLAKLANDSGCLFSISSDAHAARHLTFQRYGLAVARIAGIPKERVVNTYSRERFEDWLHSCRVR